MSYFDRLARLLALEGEAETRQLRERMARFRPGEAERSGYALTGLSVTDVHGGLGGRLLVTLAKRGAAPLPWTTLGVGTPILLTQDDARQAFAARGLVSELRERHVQIALEQFPEDLDEEAPHRIDLASDETVRKRQRAALDLAAAVREDDKVPGRKRLAQLREVLLGRAKPRFAPRAGLEPFSPLLNEPQLEAVAHALAAEDLAIIHGPPGTGKTTAVVELIRQAVARGDKVLACAPSNLGVDNILERLVAQDVPAVRIGHPARVLPALRAHTLDLMIEDHDDFKLARKLYREAQKLFHQVDRYTRAKPEPGAKAAMRREARQLLADARRFEDQAAERILDGAAVVCATATAVDRGVLGDRAFDLLVVDEAAQAVEPSCWIPLARARRLVLAGDHCQLPPTIVSREAAHDGYGVSMMERLVEHYGDAVTRRLTVQYRMHRDIMTFSSDEFYDGALVAAPAVADRRLAPGVPALTFLDTAGAGYDDELEEDGESRVNPKEAALVATLARELLGLAGAGVAPAELAIISPYAGQVRLLRRLLAAERSEGVEIDSIDGFQGREKDAVLISCVRSNLDLEIGFLAETRRMNVALTRARKRLVVVGDSATLGAHPFYERFLRHCEQVHGHESIWSRTDAP
jgi:superfamily I DNA and/or RNA helicase